MMPIDVPEILRKHRELEALISSHNWWLAIFTAAVALGIFAETIVEYSFSRDKPRAEKILTVICSLVVLGGVIGEYIQGSNVADKANELQQLADTDVARLYQQGGQANERANEANAKAEQFRLAIVQAQSEAANARLETERLRARLAPRILTSEQMATIAASLKPLSRIPDPDGVAERVTIAVFPITAEGVQLAHQIEDTLKAGDWASEDPGSGESLGIALSGVGIFVTPESSKSDQCANALSGALNANGVVSKVIGNIPKIMGCRTMALSVGGNAANTDPFCARIVVLVGNHP